MGFLKEDKNRPRGYRIPTLQEARAAWDDMRFPVAWSETERWQNVGPVQNMPSSGGDSPFWPRSRLAGVQSTGFFFPDSNGLRRVTGCTG
jgi:hypothetical protein